VTGERSEPPQRRWPGSLLTKGGTALAAVAAGVPPLLMLLEIGRAPVMNFNDYWIVLDRLTAADGSLLPRQVFTLQNEHPTFLPGLAYYADARWLGGTNHPLGLLAWLMAVGTLVLLTRMLPRGVPQPVRGGLVVLLAILVFAPKGLHNYAYGMSGVAWLSANLAAVAALYSAHRGRVPFALALGLLACLCYGTGFAVWPALLVLLILHRSRWWPAAVGLGALCTLAWLVLLSGPSEQPSGAEPQSIYGAVGTALTTLGGLSSSSLTSEVPLLVGALIVVVVGGAAADLLRRHRTPAQAVAPAQTGEPGRPPGAESDTLWPWLALAVFAVASAMLVGLSRAGFQAGGSGRYASIAALGTAAAVTIVAARSGRSSTTVTAAGLAAVALVAGSAGARTAAEVRATYPYFSLLAIAVRAEVPQTVPELPFEESVLPKLQALGAYPFDRRLDIGCGFRLGDGVDLTQVLRFPPRSALETTGSAGVVDAVKQERGVRADGWAAFDGRRGECALVVDDSGLVVGGGVTGLPRADLLQLDTDLDPALGWAVVAPATSYPAQVIFVTGDDLIALDLVTGP
jgi:hypothetical protein